MEKNDLIFREKNVEIICWYAVEHEPVPTRVVNPKACGVQGRSPSGGCGGAKPHVKKRFDEKMFENFSKKCQNFLFSIFFCRGLRPLIHPNGAAPLDPTCFELKTLASQVHTQRHSIRTCNVFFYACKTLSTSTFLSINLRRKCYWWKMS